MRTLALQSTLVAALAIGAVGGPPVADEGQTNSSADIMIPVLVNDPIGTVLLGVDDGAGGFSTGPVTLASGAVVTKVGDQIKYDPLGFVGNDSFSYVANCGTGTPQMTASIVVGVTAAQPTDAETPVDDRERTPCGTPVRIDILRNDPQSSRITGIIDSCGVFTRLNMDGDVATLCTGGTVAFVPRPAESGSANLDSILYTPPAACPFDEVFEYTTQGGRATVRVNVNDTNAPPDAQNGPPVDIADRTDPQTPIIINLLAPNVPGTKILGVNDFVVTGMGATRTLGRVELRGNSVLYTPNPVLQLNGSIDRFTYVTNGGTGTVTISIGPPGAGTETGIVTLVNNTRFAIEFRVTSTNSTDAFVDCLNLRPVTFIDTQPMTTVNTIQPLTGNPPLCVTLSGGGGGVGSNVRFEATATGTSPSICSPPPAMVISSNCFVNPQPGGVTVTVNEMIGDCTTLAGATVTNQLTGLQIICTTN